MRRPSELLRSPWGGFTLLVLLGIAGAILAYRGAHRSSVPAPTGEATVPTPSAGPAQAESMVRPAFLFKRSAPPSAAAPKTATPIAASNATAAAKPKILPISLVTPREEKAAPPERRYAPYGRLIPCETVVTLESSKLDTPVVGLVTEDVWHAGELIIPAGTEVHGRAAIDRARERIAASGPWVLVWRDGSPRNGDELVLTGIVLDRERNDVTGEFGLRDGSAGLLGTLLKTDDYQEIKLFAATFLSGMASGFQQLQTEPTLTGVTAVPEATGRNAALLGASDVLNAYARQIQEAIARDGFFVRVPAGKQFYIYVTQTIDLSQAKRANTQDSGLWRKRHESN